MIGRAVPARRSRVRADGYAPRIAGLLRSVLAIALVAMVFAPGQVTPTAGPADLAAAVLAPTSESDDAVVATKKDPRSELSARDLVMFTIAAVVAALIAAPRPGAARRAGNAVPLCSVPLRRFRRRGPPSLLFP